MCIARAGTPKRGMFDKDQGDVSEDEVREIYPKETVAGGVENEAETKLEAEAVAKDRRCGWKGVTSR